MNNSLTFIGKFPGITPDKPISFSTFDIQLGQDGVSCLPIETKTIKNEKPASSFVDELFDLS